MLLNMLNLYYTKVTKNQRYTFIVRHISFIVMFGLLYYFTDKFLESDGFMKHGTEEQKTNITLWDCIHFSLVTQTTVGYGGLIPSGPIAKIVNAIQLLTIFGVIVISLG